MTAFTISRIKIGERLDNPMRGPRVKTTPRPQGWTMSLEDEQRWHLLIRRAA